MEAEVGYALRSRSAALPAAILRKSLPSARRLRIVRDFSSIYPNYNDMNELVQDF